MTDYTSTWDALYLAMADIYDMKQKAIEEGASDYVGVADILMAYHLTLVSDMWGCPLLGCLRQHDSYASL